jgi:hypothetical protein
MLVLIVYYVILLVSLVQELAVVVIPVEQIIFLLITAVFVNWVISSMHRLIVSNVEELVILVIRGI